MLVSEPTPASGHDGRATFRPRSADMTDRCQLRYRIRGITADCGKYGAAGGISQAEAGSETPYPRPNAPDFLPTNRSPIA